MNQQGLFFGFCTHLFFRKGKEYVWSLKDHPISKCPSAYLSNGERSAMQQTFATQSAMVIEAGRLEGLDIFHDRRAHENLVMCKILREPELESWRKPWIQAKMTSKQT